MIIDRDQPDAKVNARLTKEKCVRTSVDSAKVFSNDKVEFPGLNRIENFFGFFAIEAFSTSASLNDRQIKRNRGVRFEPFAIEVFLIGEAFFILVVTTDTADAQDLQRIAILRNERRIK